jgi:hypothetical protein
MKLGWLIKRIFVDKRARERMDASRETVDKAAKKPEPVKDKTVDDGDARKILIRETMALYRKKRVEYEKLDGDLREKIDKVVREAFGEKK